MKKVVLVFCLLAAGALAWVVWFRPAREEPPEAKVPTEVPVHVGKLIRTTLRGYVSAYGTVEPEPAGERPAAGARVAPPVPGVITSVACAEGQRVEKGGLLFELDSRAADVAVAFGERTLERQKKLLQVDGTSQKAVQDAEQQLASARAQRALLRVQSPLSGTVTRLNVRPGEAVDLASVLAEVVDMERLVVNVNVPSAELGAVKSRQAAEITVGKDLPITGAVVYVSPEIDTKTGTAVARISVPAKSGLRPGQFVSVRVVTEEHKDCLAAPLASLVKDAEGAAVISLVQGDKASQKAVKAGLREGELVEIEGEGLKEGDAVVTSGAYGLPKETKIRVMTETPKTERP